MVTERYESLRVVKLWQLGERLARRTVAQWHSDDQGKMHGRTATFAETAMPTRVVLEA